MDCKCLLKCCVKRPVAAQVTIVAHLHSGAARPLTVACVYVTPLSASHIPFAPSQQYTRAALLYSRCTANPGPLSTAKRLRLPPPSGGLSQVILLPCRQLLQGPFNRRYCLRTTSKWYDSGRA